MPATALPTDPLGIFRWSPATPRIGRRAVSYYARWPSPTQGRSILLQAKELLPVTGFLEACAVLQLIQQFHEQPGVLSQTAAGGSVEYRPDFVFSRSGNLYLVFACARSIARTVDLAADLIAYYQAKPVNFRVCRFSPTKATVAALLALSPAQLKRGLLSDAERRLVMHLFEEWTDTR
ncbi:hypothetical protein LMG23992_04273 [Cupriavidus laharis]|uniref:Uncharacterized protein n=1 Tax=Cupriavidus laharis TaxID=151654 RepID=A0ABM8XK35_9BURK|nr:hypothetical protein LMG23992_04273 [Cupriavidus laharis]